MRFRLDEVRSKLGRKFIVLLFLVALLPMLLFASFSYNYLADYLYNQTQKRLINEARFYSATLYERLLLSSAHFEALAAGQVEMPAGADPSHQFDSTRQISWQHFRDLIAHIPSPERRKLMTRVEQSELGLLASPEGAVYFVQRNNKDAEFPLLLAQLSPSYLLGDLDMLDQQLTYCVFASFAERLMCTDPNFMTGTEFSHLLRKHDYGASFALDWESHGETQVAQVRNVFVTPRFGVPSWSVWVSEPQRSVFEAIANLKRMFSQVLVVGLVLALVLGVWQIKRFLTPVLKLRQGTRNIAERNFDVHIDVQSSDELQELAQSFNHMASQLGKQFDMLTGLSNIDQLILNVPDLEQVAETTLSALQRLVAADALAVVLADPDQAGTMLVFSYQRDSGRHQLFRQNLTAVEQEWFEHLDPVHRAGLNDAQYLSWLWVDRREYLGGSTHLFPIVVNKHNGGVLAVAWERSVKLPEAERNLLKDFADRLAVAITAVLREKKLYHQAHFDALTELPNRQLLKDRLEQILRHSIHKKVMGALMFVDLDNFKQINDTGGHSLGDEILRRTAERLRICVSEEDTVARQGGDEFIVVLNEIESPLRASRVAEKIIMMLSSSYRLDDRRYFLGASVGIVIFPNDGADIETLLRNADIAMYRAKEEGRGHYRFYEEKMNQESQRRITAERRVRDALEHGNVILHYQPQWYLNRDQFSLEALVRLRDPEAGIVAPADFIDVAENTGLILDIGEWVLRQACQQMASWRLSNLELERMAVNVSGKQLARMDFIKVVESAINDFNLDYSDLELEITESTLIADAESAVQKLGLLSEMGVRIAIDDFGTGYSSLSYLHRLPFDVLKIDRSFISNMHDHKRSLQITSTIVSLGKSLNKIVLAEGVETREQLEMIRQLQCDAIQGFYISRPLSAAKAEEFLTQFRPVNLPLLEGGKRS